MRFTILLALAAGLLSLPARAQLFSAIDSAAPFFASQQLPAQLKLGMLRGGITNTRSLLSQAAGKPVVITYFSPSCGHCQLEAKALADSAAQLGGLHLVWVSSHPLEALRAFDSAYGLQKAGVQLMRDVDYVLPPYFDIQFTPFTVLASPEGRLIRHWRKGASVVDLVAAASR